jgi:hypothetical protein
MDTVKKIPVILSQEEAARLEVVMALATSPDPRESEVKDRLLEQMCSAFPQFRELIDEYRREVGQ